MSSRVSPPQRGFNDEAFLRRTAILLRPPGPTSESGSQILGIWRKVENALATTLRDFESRLGLTVDRIQLDVRDSATDESSLTSAVQTAFEYSGGLPPHSLRMVFDDSGNRSDPESVRAEFSLSHFCYLPGTGKANEESAVWQTGPDNDFATVRINWTFAPHFIHDLLADIAVYRGILRHAIAHRIRLDPELRSDANRRKFAVVQNARLVPAYASLGSTNPGYVSLAAVARNGTNPSRVALTDAEASTYASLWNAAINRTSATSVSPHQDLLEQRVMELTKIRGQLSIARLRKTLDELPPGDYLLWIATKRPDDRKVQRAMAKALQRARLRIGIWRITKDNDTDSAYNAMRSFGQYCNVERLTKHR